MVSSEVLLTININQQLFADPRRMALLNAITRCGSLSKAAQQIGISYKTAWDAVHEINQLAPAPMVLSSVGGKGGGGAQLSPYAARFMQLYELLTTIQQQAFNRLADDDEPLDDLLSAVARLSLQTSARNQLQGVVKTMVHPKVAGFVTIQLHDGQSELVVSLTQKSIARLKLAADKGVILLIKAPLIETALMPLPHDERNHFDAEITAVTFSKEWIELTLQVSSQLTLYATRPYQERDELQWQIGRRVYAAISPENIILATLI